MRILSKLLAKRFRVAHLFGVAVLLTTLGFQNCSNEFQSSHLSSALPVETKFAVASAAPAGSLTWSGTPQSTDIFVNSVSGNDRNSGNIATPVQTIAAALKLAGARKAALTLASETRIWLRSSGWHQIFSPLNIGSNVVPQGKGALVIAAYPGESPVVSGGATISNWTQYNSHMYFAPTNGHLFRELYMNGQPLLRARYPRQGSTLAQGQLIYPPNAGPASIAVNPADAAWLQGANLSNLTNTELVLPRSFALSRIRLFPYVGSVDTRVDLALNQSDALIEGCATQQPGFCNVPGLNLGAAPYYSTVLGIPAAQPYYFENNPAFVTQPGDWWLDTVNNRIWMYAPAGVTSARDMNSRYFVVPMAEASGPQSLFHVAIDGIPVDSSKALTCPSASSVSNIVFSGITWSFVGAGRPIDAPYTGYIGSMSFSPQFRVVGGTKYFDFDHLHGAVEIGCANNITFQGNTFNDLGGDAIRVVPREVTLSNLTFDSNIFANVAGTALNMMEASDNITDVSVTNNLFFNIGAEYGAPATFITVKSDLTVSQNYFQYVSSSGLVISAKKYGTVNYNFLFDTDLDFPDAGALYFNNTNRWVLNPNDVAMAYPSTTPAQKLAELKTQAQNALNNLLPVCNPSALDASNDPTGFYKNWLFCNPVSKDSSQSKIIAYDNDIRRTGVPAWMPKFTPSATLAQQTILSYTSGKAVYLDLFSEGILVSGNRIETSPIPFILNCETNNWISANQVVSPYSIFSIIGCGGVEDLSQAPTQSLSSSINPAANNYPVNPVPHASAALSAVLAKVNIAAP